MTRNKVNKLRVKDCTDKEWKEILNFTEEEVPIPVVYIDQYMIKGSMIFTGTNGDNSAKSDEENKRTYYYRFINDISNNIKKGNIDYCYHEYQIKELLKYHPFNLQTRKCNGCIEVWLEDNL